MLKRILFKIYAFFFGFRFYMTSITEKDVIYNSVEINFTLGKSLKFIFYKTITEFNVYRFGRIVTKERIRYGISTCYDDENHPEFVKHFNSKLMSFYIPFSHLLLEDSISRYILDVFLEYMIIMTSEHGTLRRNGVKPDTGQRKRKTDV